MGNTRTAPTRQSAVKSTATRKAPSSSLSGAIPHSTPTSSKRKLSAEDYNNGVTPTKSARCSQTNHTKTGSTPAEAIDLTGDSPITSPAKKKASPKAPKPPNVTERRLRRFRASAPRSFLERLQRARCQRMYVVGHTVTGPEDAPEMSFDIVGSTGNIYTTTIGKEPSCSCPDARNGNQCKHIVYVLVNALKAPSHLQYQLAFISSELREIFRSSSLSREEEPKANDNDGKRKAIEGDCPICFMEFEPEKEEIVWCRAACGNNIHKTCFQQWAATQSSQGVRCVYCRSPWETDNSNLNLQQLKQNGRVNADGYINVADQVGLSGERDYSTYHQPWVSRRFYSYGSRRNYWGDDDYYGGF